MSTWSKRSTGKPNSLMMFAAIVLFALAALVAMPAFAEVGTDGQAETETEAVGTKTLTITVVEEISAEEIEDSDVPLAAPGLEGSSVTTREMSSIIPVAVAAVLGIMIFALHRARTTRAERAFRERVAIIVNGGSGRAN